MRSESSPHRATGAASRSEVLLLRVCVGGRRAGLVVDVVKRDACVAIETVQRARASRRWPVLRHDSSVRTNIFARRYVRVRDLVPLVPLPPISDLTHGEETSPPYTLASRCRPTSRRPSRTFGTGWSRSLDHAWRRASRPKRSLGNPPTPHHRHAFPGPQPRAKICYWVPEYAHLSQDHLRDEIERTSFRAQARAHETSHKLLAPSNIA